MEHSGCWVGAKPGALRPQPRVRHGVKPRRRTWAKEKQGPVLEGSGGQCWAIAGPQRTWKRPRGSKGSASRKRSGTQESASGKMVEPGQGGGSRAARRQAGVTWEIGYRLLRLSCLSILAGLNFSVVVKVFPSIRLSLIGINVFFYN